MCALVVIEEVYQSALAAIYWCRTVIAKGDDSNGFERNNRKQGAYLRIVENCTNSLLPLYICLLRYRWQERQKNRWSLLENCSQRSGQRKHTRLAKIEFAWTETVIRLDEMPKNVALNIRRIQMFVMKRAVLNSLNSYGKMCHLPRPSILRYHGFVRISLHCPQKQT